MFFSNAMNSGIREDLLINVMLHKSCEAHPDNEAFGQISAINTIV